MRFGCHNCDEEGKFQTKKSLTAHMKTCMGADAAAAAAAAAAAGG
jgi:hypothetical protein